MRKSRAHVRLSVVNMTQERFLKVDSCPLESCQTGIILGHTDLSLVRYNTTVHTHLKKFLITLPCKSILPFQYPEKIVVQCSDSIF